MDTSYFTFLRETQRGEYQTDRNDFILHLFRENTNDDTSNTYDSKFSEREEADDDEGVAREQREF